MGSVCVRKASSAKVGGQMCREVAANKWVLVPTLVFDLGLIGASHVLPGCRRCREKRKFPHLLALPIASFNVPF